MDLKELINKYQKVPVVEYPNKVLESIPKPMVSCRVCTYQHSGYIKQCLDGILMQQTNFPFEIVIGEDESSDGTREICIEYANKYPNRIRLFLHRRENNIQIDGKPSAKFQGWYTMFHCRGEYQAVCEGDDYWMDPLKLQKQVDFLQSNKDYSICFHAVNEQNMVTREVYASSLNHGDHPVTFTLNDLVKGNIMHTPSILFRNKLFTSFPDCFMEIVTGDYATSLLIASYGKLRYMPDIMAVYRRHPSSNWSAIAHEARLYSWIKMLKLLIGEFDGEAKQLLVRQLYENLNIYLRLLQSQQKVDDYIAATKDLLFVFREDDSLADSWINNEFRNFVNTTYDFPVGVKASLRHFFKQCWNSIKSRV